MYNFNTKEIEYLPMDGVLPNENYGKWLIEREPMLFQSNAEFSFNAGGPITKDVLDRLRACTPSKVFNKLRIDTRSHMLMPGFFPCIPGYHCDFMQTTESGKQMMSTHDEDIEHYMFLSGPPSTEFIKDRNIVWDKDIFTWKEVSNEMNSRKLETFKVPTGQLIKFNARELHRGTPHEGPPGHWRYFFRATSLPEWHQDYGKFTNKIRHQVQVYCDLNEGW